jgi:predicted permease
MLSRALQRMWQDLLFAFRTLRQHPVFGSLVIVTLAIGIGGSTTIFAVINRVLLQAVPYSGADRLAMIWESSPTRQLAIAPVRAANFIDWKRRTQSFEEIGVSRDTPPVELTPEGGHPESVVAYRFSNSMFHVLGMKPLIGRTFREDEDRPSTEPVVVLSYKLWSRSFGRDPNIVGKFINISGTPTAVIGVMPSKFQHPPKVELWLPLSLSPASFENRNRFELRLVGRLKPGVSIDQAQGELRAISRELASEHPETNSSWTVAVQSLRDVVVGDIRLPLLIVFGAVVMLLLLAVVNVTSLMFSRMYARSREVSIRAALGASRLDLFRQIFAECLVLSLVGAILGDLLALWLTEATVSILPTNISNVGIPIVESIPIDLSVLGFSALLALLSAALIGIPTAVRAGVLDLNENLKDTSASSIISRRAKRVHRALIVSEMTIAILVLIAATLTFKSFSRLQDVPLGFERSHLLSMYITMSAKRYPDEDSQRSYVRKLRAELSQLPGVEEVGGIDFLPLSGFWNSIPFNVEGMALKPEERPESDLRIATPGYFESMRIGLRSGRTIQDSDSKQTPLIAVVNETFAHKYLPQSDPVGRRLNLGSLEKPEWAQIVGVTRDVKHFGLDQETHPELYLSFDQVPNSMVAFVLRTKGDPTSLADAARAAIWRIDKDQPVTRMISMEAAAEESLAIRRITTVLLTMFSSACLFLACLGTYGVVSQGVQQRTREIGLRMALGSTPSGVVRRVLAEGASLAIIGAAIGLALAFLIMRVLSSILFGVTATDPPTFVLSSIVISLVALVASAIPAWRAMRIDPATALRHE